MVQDLTISICARSSYLIPAGWPPGSTDMCRQRLSSVIRGEQIAERWPAKYNPKDNSNDSLRLFVKPRVDRINRIADGDWVDVSDSHELVEPLQQRPKLKVIATALYSYKYLRELLPNQLIHISQQHLNWERAVRDREEITTVGIIGRFSGRALSACRRLEEAIKPMGLQLVTCFNYVDRMDAVNFFKQIDILAVPPIYGDKIDFPHRTPTKMINAASFGIPSVAHWKPAYEEFEGYYMPARDMEGIINGIKILTDPTCYTNMSREIIKAAEPYHIDNVVKKYRELEEL